MEFQSGDILFPDNLHKCVDKNRFSVGTPADEKQALVDKNARVKALASELLDRIDLSGVVGKHLI